MSERKAFDIKTSHYSALKGRLFTAGTKIKPLSLGHVTDGKYRQTESTFNYKTNLTFKMFLCVLYIKKYLCCLCIGHT